MKRIKQFLATRWGFMTKEEHLRLLEGACKLHRQKHTSLMLANVELKEKLAKQPYEFDNLLENYNSDQLNAWYYKLVNYAYQKDPSLLERFAERLQDAMEHAK